MQNHQTFSSKPLDEMTPVEMMAELMFLRQLSEHVARLTAERTYLYMLLQQHGIIPIIIPNEEQEGDT